MITISRDEEKHIDACVEVYRRAFKEKPWEEDYEFAAVKKYIEKFMKDESRCCFILKEDEGVIGLALGVIMPSIDADYLRIEDFCVAPEKQKSGMGSGFIQLISQQLEALECDSILLGTQRDYPAHKFYVKNGFREIESSVLLYYEQK